MVLVKLPVTAYWLVQKMTYVRRSEEHTSHKKADITKDYLPICGASLSLATGRCCIAPQTLYTYRTL